MSRAVTLLTLDAGSVLYNPEQMPSEVVLRHEDSELIKVRRSDTGDWLSQRREEAEVNFWEDGKYKSPVTAVATLADRQAFGFRMDGEPVNPLAISGSPKTIDTIEVEGLALGGIVFEDQIHLPFAVYTTDEVYYRAFISADNTENSRLSEPTAVLEKRKGPRGEWEELLRSEPTEVGHLVKTIADETGMEATSGSVSEIRGVLEDHHDLFKASRTHEDEELREKMAIQNNTAFSASIPKPRPVDFPT